jgi:hypothetical protein
MPQVHLVGLVKLFFENISPALQSGTGLIPLSWQEIESYVRVNNIPLNNFELNVIKSASQAYVSQSFAASNPNCPPPYRLIKRDETKFANYIREVLVRDAPKKQSGLAKKGR